MTQILIWLQIAYCQWREICLHLHCLVILAKRKTILCYRICDQRPGLYHGCAGSLLHLIFEGKVKSNYELTFWVEKVESNCFSKIFVSNTMESNRKHLALVIYINTLPKNDQLNQTGAWDKCVFDRRYTSWSPVWRFEFTVFSFWLTNIWMWQGGAGLTAKLVVYWLMTCWSQVI